MQAGTHEHMCTHVPTDHTLAEDAFLEDSLVVTPYLPAEEAAILAATGAGADPRPEALVLQRGAIFGAVADRRMQKLLARLAQARLRSRPGARPGARPS